MSDDPAIHLFDVAWDQAATVRQSVDDWSRAKRENMPDPGSIYGRRLVMALWELYDTVDTIRSTRTPKTQEAIGRLLGQYLGHLGRVDRDGLYFAARATWHRADATVGGRTAKYFGGAPVAASTATITRMGFPGWADVGPDSDEWHAAYVVDDVTITLVGTNPERGVTIAADAAHEAASQLVDELGWILGNDAAG